MILATELLKFVMATPRCTSRKVTERFGPYWLDTMYHLKSLALVRDSYSNGPVFLCVHWPGEFTRGGFRGRSGR